MLLDKEENPFTREKLTKEDLIEYNDKDHIVKKIESFKMRFNEWKKKHRI